MKMINGEEFYSTGDQVEIIREALPKLDEIDNEIELRVEIKKISEEISIPEEEILILVKKYREGPEDKYYPSIKLDLESGNVTAEKLLIRCMLGDKETAKKILKKIRLGDFSVLLHRKIVRAVDRILENDEEINPQNLLDYLPSLEAVKIVIDILMRKEITLDEKVIFGYIDTEKNFKVLSRKNKS